MISINIQNNLVYLLLQVKYNKKIH